MARTYCPQRPEFPSLTWGTVMEHYVETGVESTRDRKGRAFRSRPFAVKRDSKLIETEAIHLLNVIEHRGPET